MKFNKLTEKEKATYDAGEDCYEDEHKGHWEMIK